MPTTITCSVSPCEVVVSLSLVPFDLSMEDAALISGAVLLVWTVAWGFRVLIRVLNVDSKTSTSESETS